MDIKPQLIAAYLVNIVVLFVFLRLVLYKPIRRFLQEREARFQRRQEDIERKERDSLAAKERYDGLLAGIDEHRDEILRDTRGAANRRAEEILDEARQQADDLLRQARRQIAEEQRLARQHMRDEIVDLAVDMASRILEREVNPDDHERIVQKFLRDEKVG